MRGDLTEADVADCGRPVPDALRLDAQRGAQCVRVMEAIEARRVRARLNPPEVAGDGRTLVDGELSLRHL